MKIVFAYITIFLLSMSFLVVADVLAGMKLSTAIDVIKESFAVSTTVESAVIALLISIPILPPLVTVMKRWKKTRSPRNPS